MLGSRHVSELFTRYCDGGSANFPAHLSIWWVKQREWRLLLGKMLRSGVSSGVSPQSSSLWECRYLDGCLSASLTAQPAVLWKEIYLKRGQEWLPVTASRTPSTYTYDPHLPRAVPFPRRSICLVPQASQKSNAFTKMLKKSVFAQHPASHCGFISLWDYFQSILAPNITFCCRRQKHLNVKAQIKMQNVRRMPKLCIICIRFLVKSMPVMTHSPPSNWGFQMPGKWLPGAMPFPGRSGVPWERGPHAGEGCACSRILLLGLLKETILAIYFSFPKGL